MSKFSWVNFFLGGGGRGRLKPLNPAGCYNSVYIYIAIVLHNFVFLLKISLLNSHESILSLQNLCRNIFDLYQSFAVLLSICFVVYVCYYLDLCEIISPISMHILCKTIEAMPNLFKVSGLLLHFLLNTLQCLFSFPKAPLVTILALLNL